MHYGLHEGKHPREKCRLFFFIFLKGGIFINFTLSKKDFETVMNALLNAQHEFNFLHGLRVTDVHDVKYTWELDCSYPDNLINEAISVLDKLSDTHN